MHVGHDDDRRRSRRRGLARAGRLHRPRRRARRVRPAEARRRRARDGARRHPAARPGLPVERRERADQHQRRSPRPAGRPHLARAGGGEVRHLPRHAARTAPLRSNADDPLVAAVGPLGAARQCSSYATRGNARVRHHVRARWHRVHDRGRQCRGATPARARREIVAPRRGAGHADRPRPSTTSRTRWRPSAGARALGINPRTDVGRACAISRTPRTSCPAG